MSRFRRNWLSYLSIVGCLLLTLLLTMTSNAQDENPPDGEVDEVFYAFGAGPEPVPTCTDEQLEVAVAAANGEEVPTPEEIEGLNPDEYPVLCALPLSEPVAITDTAPVPVFEEIGEPTATPENGPGVPVPGATPTWIEGHPTDDPVVLTRVAGNDPFATPTQLPAIQTLVVTERQTKEAYTPEAPASPQQRQKPCSIKVLLLRRSMSHLWVECP